MIKFEKIIHKKYNIVISYDTFMKFYEEDGINTAIRFMCSPIKPKAIMESQAECIELEKPIRFEYKLVDLLFSDDFIIIYDNNKEYEAKIYNNRTLIDIVHAETYPEIIDKCYIYKNINNNHTIELSKVESIGYL